MERSLLPPLLFTSPPLGHFYVRQQNPLLGLRYRMQWCFKGFFFFFAINISVLSTQNVVSSLVIILGLFLPLNLLSTSSLLSPLPALPLKSGLFFSVPFGVEKSCHKVCDSALNNLNHKVCSKATAKTKQDWFEAIPGHLGKNLSFSSSEKFFLKFRGK